MVLCMRILLALILALAPLPVRADPLRSLQPLIEVFAADGDTPGWDVAGIRCAGLFYAQESWRRKHGGQGPKRRFLDGAAIGLERSVQYRVNLGQSLTKATLSVEDDLTRVIKLYTQRFNDNARAGHPWQGDPDLKGDKDYCELVSD